MRYHRGNSRYQQSFLSMDDQISKGHVVRVIDDICENFCTTITLDKGIKDTGRKAYHPADLLKILVYGYFNGTSSSRKLEREAQRNVELKWLTSNVVPDHKTISDFRKDNPELVDSLFKYLIIRFKEQGLIAGKSIAVDGTKVKANASKEINIETISEKLKGIEKQVEKYLKDIDAIDKAEDEVEDLTRKKAALERELEALAAKKKEYQEQADSLKALGENRRSTTDAESKIMRGRTGSYWGYNVQSAVDTEHHLITVIQVTNQQNDKGLLTSMLEASQAVTGQKVEEGLADAGYYKITELEQLENQGTECYVAISRTHSQVKDQANEITFNYNGEQDLYTCSEGRQLRPVGSKKRRNGKLAKAYRGTECHLCPKHDQCTSAEQRTFHRNENQGWIDAYHKKMKSKEGKEKLKKRRSVVEHPFGTMKYCMGQIPLLLRGKEKAQTEMNLYSIGYNLKRYFKLKTIEKVSLSQRIMSLEGTIKLAA
jgi:transposase/phage shock protein A